MAYANQKQDHEKRKNQEGSYSVYNHMYEYLLSNYEPENLESSYTSEAAENILIKIGIAYAKKGGNTTDYNTMKQNARQAIANFVNNNGKHGDTADMFGKAQNNSINSIKQSLQDLKW